MSEVTEFYSVPPSGTVTFLFTDIEGSTKLAQDYPDAMPSLLARHNEILKGAIDAHHGFVFQIVGDAFCASFQNVHDALNAALDAQRVLHGEAWTSAPVRVRMGIHTGNAEYDQNGEYQGYLTLSHVQRLMSAAHGGQVLLSLATRDFLQDRLPDGVTLRDMGARLLKDMQRPEPIYQLVAIDLPDEFPPIKTVDPHQHNLPAPMTSFIGRERELAEIKAALREHRLVTLTGSGGAGKSRLSLQVGMECLREFRDGVWLVELAPVTDPGLVPQAFLSVFKLREDRQHSVLDVLVNYLRDQTVLLILDNCEHLIDACAQVSASLLQACPHLRILASSREALGITGEVAYRVPSLDTPDPADLPALDELEKMDSIRLFLERAATAKPGFTLTDDKAPFIAQICSRLDGIPLAIELAASRVKVLSPDQIAARLDDRFRLLTGGSRTALPRQQTLRAMIDWSYSLLSEQEQTLFRRLAVFVGGWTLEAAESICSDATQDKNSPNDVLDLLTRLVDKSLVVIEETADGLRYHRLETIRQYSREKFLETNEVEEIRDRHLDFFVRFVELADQHLKGRDQVLWQKQMYAEQDNLRVALDWGVSRSPYKALRIVGAANLFWTAAGFSAEGFRWTQKALEQVQENPFIRGTTAEERQIARAKALQGLTRLYLSLGDNAKAKRAAEESVAIYRRTKDRRGLSFALVVLAYPLEFLGERNRAAALLRESYSIARAENYAYGMCRSLNVLARVIVRLHDDLDSAQRYVEESIRLAEEDGLRSQEAQAYEVSAMIAIRRDDPDKARHDFEESVRIYDEIEASFNVILEKSNLAHMERKLGNYERALDYYRETILAFRNMGQFGAVCHQLECFGFIALARYDNECALQLFAAANALREKSSTPMTPDEQIYFDEQLRILRERMDHSQFDSTWSTGLSLRMEQAIELAIEKTLEGTRE